MDVNQLTVVHNPAENRFEVIIDGKRSVLDYAQNGDVIVMMHVGVHPDHRGGGVAGKITQTALEYARQNGLQVVPVCSYVAAYIRRNPQYQVLLEPAAGRAGAEKK